MISMDNPTYSFRFVSLKGTLDPVKVINPKNASHAIDIPVKIIKKNKDIVSFYTFYNLSNALRSCSFPTLLKYVDIRLRLKDDETDK